LLAIIKLVTNIAFYGTVSTDFVSPAGNHLGLWVIGIPVIGGIIVGIMARYGSQAIRGHGIPEAMEQVLFNQSRIPPRLTFLKPLSAAFAIGTGGPFGAEGPIIATGGALGSLVGQVVKTTAVERKTLLAAGAAAGMAATFGCPVAAVLLAIELLLFEYRARSVIPVALASATATAVRMAFVGSAPMFPMVDLVSPSGLAMAGYIVLGAFLGIASVGVTKGVYWVEDTFEKLPIHWMWWPAIGAVFVGVVGYFAPRTLGVGYDIIEQLVQGELGWKVIAVLAVMKLISWTFSLGSGTSGGTLAPLFIIGGGFGATLGYFGTVAFPGMGLDIRLAALVGMAAMFAGASRALLASVVFAFEVTMQPIGLLPLLAGCSASFMVSALFMRNSIMTEKIARRGIKVASEYSVDYLDQVLVGAVASRPPVTLDASQDVGSARMFFRGLEHYHQGFPVVDKNGKLIGLVMRREIMDPTLSDVDLRVSDLIWRPPVVAYEENTLREAADLMVSERVGRLPVVARANPRKVVGIITRSDLLDAHLKRIQGVTKAEQQLSLPVPDVLKLHERAENSLKEALRRADRGRRARRESRGHGPRSDH
ncbi:MAG TPA: chloride channel protein, partial [Kofleriaceae bacterium]|nr:chloride channel protein [Kofleriaceae bacterium]